MNIQVEESNKIAKLASSTIEAKQHGYDNNIDCKSLEFPDRGKSITTQKIKRITIVTAAFLVAYTLAMTLNSVFYSSDEEFYSSQQSVRDVDYVRQETDYLTRFFCKGGRRSIFCGDSSVN